MLLVIASSPRMKRRFYRLAKRMIRMTPEQEVTHLGKNTFIVDESHKTLYKVIQEMQRSKRMQVYRITPVTHGELVDQFIA